MFYVYLRELGRVSYEIDGTIAVINEKLDNAMKRMENVLLLKWWDYNL